MVLGRHLYNGAHLILSKKICFCFPYFLETDHLQQWKDFNSPLLDKEKHLCSYVIDLYLKFDHDLFFKETK